MVELTAYIAEDDLRAAERVVTRILKAAALLSQFPRTGRAGRVAGTREQVVRRTPYILVYNLAPTRVRVLRVYHGSRSWPQPF